jgi:tetratricopeptide (TPR) repeat protein
LLAELNVRTGALQVAITDLEKFITTQPQTVGAYMLLGSAYLAQRQAAKAIETARRLMAVAPTDARGPFLFGLGLRAQGQHAEARREFETALELSPGFLDPLAQLISLALADKQSDAALTVAKKQAALIPQSAPHQMLLAGVHVARREPDLAETAYLKAIELEPTLTEPYRLLAALYAQSRRYDQALARLGALLRVNPRDASTLMVMGVVYEQQGDIPKARDAYEKALAITPRFAAAANNLAWIYSEHGGDKDKALSLARTAKEVAPDDPRISDTLGWILYKGGLHQQALVLLKASASKLPDNPEVQYHLGKAYAHVGDKDGARKALTVAVNSPQAFPGKDDARKALGDLQ